MDDYTIEEKDKEVTGITVMYDDGSTKEIQQGCCVDLKNGSDDLSVGLLNIKAFDLVKLTYGLMVVIEKIGLIQIIGGMSHVYTSRNERKCRTDN